MFLRLRLQAFQLFTAFILVVGAGQIVSAEQFRIGYLEGGPYWIFSESLEAVKTSLEARGRLDEISFPRDAHLSPGWDQEELWNESARKLMERRDLDLIIAAGTDATRSLLKANNHKTPVVAMAVSDPIGAGFVHSAEDSGIDNFTVRLEPDRFERMFTIFHQVVGFEKLGLIYQDTESGRQFTSLSEARKVAPEKGFELIEYDSLASESLEDCLAAVEHLLGQGMDAFFIPSLNAFDWEQSDVDKILSYLREQGIPTFARNGSRDVKAGALMGFSTVDFSRRGDFLSQMIIAILEGERPRSLNMVDRVSPKISFNIQVANEIGFNPPFDLLAATDELYRRIILPENRLVKD